MPFFFAPASAGAPALRTANFPVVGAITYSIWWAIVTAGATVISRVVFGLRAEMRRARRLGQYTIEAKIGEGGMGVVYRAHHGMMRRPTAIKLLRPEKAIAANLKRFEREVQLTARLTHPHTITIFDYGRTPEGLFYYAMELLDGASLDRVVAVAGRLGPARVIHVLYEVAGALVEAHESGLIHRDIKPANIILCRQGGLYDFPKVVDFGLVKDLEPAASAALTRADVIAGTPLYIAPEAITSPESVSPQSDLYSLGAVGYFALTGQNPFQGRTLVEVCSHHLHTKPEPPSTRLDEPLPADLEALVLDCLEKDPTRRPASARELRRRLEGLRGLRRLDRGRRPCVVGAERRSDRSDPVGRPGRRAHLDAVPLPARRRRAVSVAAHETAACERNEAPAWYRMVSRRRASRDIAERQKAKRRGRW